MSTVFFAARQLHKNYFAKLSQKLDDDSVVLWYKNLSQPCVLSAPSSDIQSLVNDHLKEKQNSLKGRSRSSFYWRLFKSIKTIEARWLFKLYANGLKKSNCQQMVIWNGLKYRQRIAVTAAKALKLPIIYMENGLIPGMTTIDAQGINYRNSAPRHAEFYLNLANASKTDSSNNGFLTLQKQLRSNLSKKPQTLPDRYIFVPFQVNTDSQVVLFSPWLKDMFALVETFSKLCDQLGDSSPIFIFKTHPACDEKYQQLIKQYQNHSHIQFCNSEERKKISTLEYINYADAVITINSTVGIEALLLEKKVITLGQAFYNIENICLSSNNLDQLKENITKLDNWQPSALHVEGLFQYLINHYQVAGRWQDSSEQHLALATDRIKTIEQEQA